MNTAGKKKDTILWMIVAFKFFKGALLIAVGLGAHHLIDRDVGDFLNNLADAIRVDPGSRYLQAFIEKADLLTDRQLKELSFGSFFYAAIVLTEGIGLALRKPWGEYFTIIVTASFVPLEIYEIVHGVNALKIVVLILNLVIVAYLISRIRGERRQKARPA